MRLGWRERNVGDVKVSSIAKACAVMVDPSPETTLHVRMTYMLADAAQVFPKARNLDV